MKNSAKRKVIVIGVLALSILCFGLNAQAAALKPYKIGLVLAITGPYSFLGEPQKKAALMVQEQINKAGGINGHPLELKIMDSQTDPSKAVTALQSLLRDPEILAVAGGSSSPDNFAMIPIIEKEGLTLMSCGGSIKISDPVKKWVFQIPATDRIAMRSILKYLKSKNIAKVAMIHSTGGWGMSGAEQLKEQAPNFGITVLSYESFGDKDVDMTPQLTHMRDLNPQAIISWTATAAGAIISKNIKQLGIKALHVHDHGFGNLKFVKIAGDAANDGVLPMGKIVVADQIDPKDPQKKALIDFKEQYEKQWNETIPAFAAHTFDGLMILKRALETAGPDRAKVRDAIENMKNFIGINGVFNFSPRDHNGLDESAMVMIRIANQNWQVIKE